MFKYNIIDKPTFDINKKVIDTIFNIVWNIVNIPQKWTLNIVFLDDDSIKNLNKNYRNIDASTDVLSFHYFDDFSKINDNEIAWEIILSENKIKQQAIEYWLGNEKEFYKLIIHSILHILWFDHELDNEYEIMQDFENKIWLEVFWN